MIVFSLKSIGDELASAENASIYFLGWMYVPAEL